MCGILATNSKDERRIQKARKLLEHRGPDGEGGGRFHGLRLHHSRLAIVDPQGGAQPMRGEDDSWALVFNGEIYNHLEIRQRLGASYSFKTACDSEVIGPLWRREGVEGLRTLDGMFAFVLATPEGWVAARDPLGIKPLYVMEDRGEIWLASEIKVLHSAGKGRIREFPPGFVYCPGAGFRRLSRIEARGPYPDLKLARELIRVNLRRAVEKRLMADVPVGVLLSGGLDSSLVAALARPRLKEMHTFSVGLAGSPDLAQAKEVAAFLGSIHHERVLTPYEVMEIMPRIIYHLESSDRDLVRSAVPCWFASELASRHVKVVLTGEGADELFAGYGYLGENFFGLNLRRELRRLTRGLHLLNLQRLDRMSMVHGLEGRVPFLDMDMLRVARSLDPADLERRWFRPDKWLLRTSFPDLLPSAILQRPKAQFDQGTGVAELLARLARGTLGKTPESHPGLPPPRDREEAWYQDVLLHRFDASRVRSTLGVWNPPPGAPPQETNTVPALRP